MQSRWFQNKVIQAFPLAHLMRENFSEHWMRIHSLPEGKRYPDNQSEKEIVLDRYARFGTALLGEKSPCLIIQSRMNGDDRKLLPEFQWNPIHQIKIDDEEVWNSWSASVIWTPDSFRSLLLAIAEDTEEYVAFLSHSTDCVFIPYDGGSDGFSFDPKLLARLSDEFTPWLSNHPDGF
jgi:hypothetical protein